MDAIIDLYPWEYERGFAVGIARFTANWGRPDARHYDRSRMEEDRNAQAAAALCEIAVARHVNEYAHLHVWHYTDRHRYRHLADVGDDKFTLVFDYKRRETSFSWPEFYHGLDIQLPIYMLAVRNATDVGIRNVVGAFYMPIEISPKKAALDELSGRDNRFNYKTKGIFNGDFFRLLDRSDSNKFYNFFVTKKGDQYGYDSISGALRPEVYEKVLTHTRHKIIQLAQEIVSGKIDVSPYRLSGGSPCSYCMYKPVCRFDWQINDYNFLESLSKSQVLERAEVVDG